jgi:hypothetical protein
MSLDGLGVFFSPLAGAFLCGSRIEFLSLMIGDNANGPIRVGAQPPPDDLFKRQPRRFHLLQQALVELYFAFDLAHDDSNISPNAHPGEIIFSGRTMASNSSFVT